MIHALVVLVLSTQAATAPGPGRDSTAQLKRLARRAETEYEALAMRLVPSMLGNWGSGPCDETVGRFCLHYDTPGEKSRPVAPEHPRTVAARRAAIEACRRAFSALPGDPSIARPLIRF